MMDIETFEIPENKAVQSQEQLFVDQLSQKVDQLRNEFDLQNSIKGVHNSLNQRIQQQRDKICDVLRKIQGRRDKDKKKKTLKLTDESDLVKKDKEEEIEEFIREFVQDKDISQKNQQQLIKSQIEYQEMMKKETEVLRRRNYIYQFKNYLKRKQERLEQQQEFKVYQEIDKKTGSYQKWVAQDKNDSTMYEFFYSQIDKKNKKQVHELQVKEFLFDNPLIMQLFNLKRETIQSSMDKFQTAVKYHYNINEFVNFLKLHQKQKNVDSLKSFVHLLNDSYKTINLLKLANYRVNLLSQESIQLIYDVFNELDSGRTGTVELDHLIKEIRLNEKTTPLLFQNAIHYVSLGTNLSLEVALQILEIESLESQSEDTVVSWNQFYSIFNQTQQIEEESKPGQLEQQIENHQDSFSQEEEEQFYKKIASKTLEVVRSKSAQIKKKRKQKLNVAAKFDVEKMKFTIPKRPQFEKREEKRKLSPTIRQLWLQQLVGQKKQEEEERYKYKPFKAHKIPFKVANKALYGDLLELEEIKRREIKEQSQEKTLRTQMPFTFYERDKLNKDKQQKEIEEYKKMKEEGEKYIFKANPMPWYASLQLYHRKKKDQDEEREMKRKIRENYLIMNSKLPPRMQKHIEEQEIKKLEKQAEQEDRYKTQEGIDNNYKFTFFPKPANPIPDFEQLHKEFQNQLNARKRKQRVTIPVEPTFHQSKKQVKRDYLDEENQTRKSFKRDPILAAKKALAKKSNRQPPSTLKFEAMVEKGQREREFQAFLKDKQIFEEQQRLEKKQLFIPRVQKSWAIADHSQQLEQQQYQKMVQFYLLQKQQEEEFNNMMKDIFLRVYQRPLLMEIETMKAQQQQMMQEGEEEEENPDEQKEQYPPGYNEMNPIGEDDELEYLKQQAIYDKDEEHDNEGHTKKKKIENLKKVQNNYDFGDDEIDFEQQQSSSQQRFNQLDKLKNDDENDNENEYDDPEGVDLVGDQAEKSQDPDQEQYDYDPQEYIDLENIDPALLEELQKQALAEQYGQQDDEDEDDENMEGMEYYGQHHHSF